MKVMFLDRHWRIKAYSSLEESMGGLIHAATAIMASSSRCLDIAAANLANLSTPGYKTVATVRRTLSGSSLTFSEQLEQTRTQLDQGKLISTGRTFDIAVMGQGFLAVRAGDVVSYRRNGQFTRTRDNLLVTLDGGILQQASGGDLNVTAQRPEIVEDGTVLEEGRATGRIGLFSPADGEKVQSLDGASFDLGASPVTAESAAVRQGFLEASNVDTGNEMVTMMAALRQSEAGAKLVQTYDELLGKAFTTLGQSGR